MENKAVAVRIGTIVETDYGRGPVIAITKQWLIHGRDDGEEICVYLPDESVWVPADFSVQDIPEGNAVDLPVR